MIFLSRTFPLIFNALAQREGKKVTLPTLRTVTGLTAQQIQLAIRNARATNTILARQIVVVKPGRVWLFKADEVDVSAHYPVPEDVVKEVEVGSTHIWKTILAVLVKHPGEILYKAELARRASTPERTFTEQQVTNAMSTILRQPGMADSVETVWANNAWRYKAPEPAPTPTPTPEKTKETKETKETKSDSAKDASTVSAPIRGSVLRYFTRKPGETLFVNDIASDLGFSKEQIQNAVWFLTHRNETIKDDFTTVQSGYAWQYKPNKPVVEVNASSNGHAVTALAQAPAQAYTPQAVTTTLPVSSKVPDIPKPTSSAGGRLFEEIGQTTEGAVLVKESESGVIYRATPLA